MSRERRERQRLREDARLVTISQGIAPAFADAFVTRVVALAEHESISIDEAIVRVQEEDARLVTLIEAAQASAEATLEAGIPDLVAESGHTEAEVREEILKADRRLGELLALHGGDERAAIVALCRENNVDPEPLLAQREQRKAREDA